MGTHSRTGVKHLLMGTIARIVSRSGNRHALIEEALEIKGEPSETPYEFPVP